MTAFTFKKIGCQVLVIGPLYDKLDKLDKIKELSSNYELVIFNGNLCYPFDNLDEVERRIDILDGYLKPGRILYNLGNYDLVLSQKLNEVKGYDRIKQWLKSFTNVFIIGFRNQTTCIITSGGLTNEMKREHLLDNIETSFVSYIDHKPWHVKYGGMQGYVVSNSPLTFQEPQFYNFSAQIGNDYGPETKVYAAEIGPAGLKQTILL